MAQTGVKRQNLNESSQVERAERQSNIAFKCLI